MEIFGRKLLVCDLDDTLLDSNCEISVGNRNALMRFVGNGNLFTIATGRDERSVRTFLPNLPINIPAILHNGATLYDFSSDTVLWERYFNINIVPTILKIMRSFPTIGVEVYGDQSIYILRSNDIIFEHVLRDQFIPIHLKPENLTYPIKKVILAGEIPLLMNIESFLKTEERALRFVYSRPDFLELLHPEASKGNALMELVSILGLDNNSTIAVGDNLNDLDMIQNAYIGIAVENAHVKLKESANYCCRNHDDDAIVQVIEWIEGSCYGQ